MKAVTALAVVAVLVVHLDPTRSAGSCEYTTAGGKTIHLEYLEFMGKGEAFVEFEDDRVCLRRISCSTDYAVKIEHCHDAAISCETSSSACKQRYFPQCCSKCLGRGLG